MVTFLTILSIPIPSQTQQGIMEGGERKIRLFLFPWLPCLDMDLSIMAKTDEIFRV